ncbi:MCE family protein [Campylobacter sp. VicNov18]|uniref:MlaD family protein n=1 Tax=Campylobacter bilis TaxID=2691918 RepID=UPI0013240B5A|nr:MlaD family protein [Campylobacter bilis]MPV63742.1 MCE family protein [Campylobacter hepaticus]MBM0637243.1 MCE family protein [Campylobacter bilis]MCC8277962.1 MCE family protein [Campylobacter bilis]MCC8299466.1 MCE family protein [Campylobacter bilis]MCC8300871.1 MCE family protein [Campylobacter bilis]
MENRSNYFLVGIFVFGVFFASLGFMLWLGGYTKEESFKYYEIHTQESVAGLSLKAPVRLLGVEVGSVEQISIYDQDELGVNILIKVQNNTPIKEDTFATLQLQGITGLKFVQLQGGNKNSKDLIATHTKFPIIPFKESFLATIDRQSEYIFSLIKTADTKSKELLSEKNLKNVEIFLQNLAQLSANLNDHSKNLSLNLSNASLKVANMAQNISLSAQNFNSSLVQIKQSISMLNNLIKKTDTKLDSYDDIKTSLMQNLELFKRFLIEANILIQSLQNSPSDLIFKESKPKLGPGEK